MNLLDEIIAYKKKELADLKSKRHLNDLEKSEYFTRKAFSLTESIMNPLKSGIIAEFKRKSPSRGIINSEAGIKEVTTGYSKEGASGLSILTDPEYFGGNNEDLSLTRTLNVTPILRKDFIIDEYQVIESKSIGADVILLIAAALKKNQITRLARFAWLVLGWNLVVISWGAFVRATGSGAGCGAHWPLCGGEVVPRSPAVETMIEFTHRSTSAVALLLVVALAILVFRERRPGHPARRAAVASLVFILTEAAVGAGLVLFQLVAANESAARAFFMAAHLVNTFLLLAALSLTAHWADLARPHREAVWRDGWLFGLGLLGLLAVGMSGAVAALGDTLYPAQSLLGGLAQDVATTSLLVRMHLAHPALALAASFLAAFAAARVLQATDDPATRRAAWTVPLLALAQLAAGLANVALLAPVWMQLVHLLLADLLWIAFVLLAARSLVLPLPRALSIESAAAAA